MKSMLFVLLSLSLLQQVVAQDKMGVVSIYKNNREGKRKALVLANQNYQHQPPLKNTLRDADSMAVALRYLGFEVMLVKDKTLAQTKDAIDKFNQSLQPADIAFVYYSGHGLGYLRDNYLLPIEFSIENFEEIKNRSISLTELRDGITRRSVRNLFLVVDACRNEFATKGEGAFKLVAPEDNPQGTLLAFATDYGQTATYQSKQNKNSLYTESLLAYLRQPLEVQEIFRKANNRTYAESKRLGQPTQYPHYISMIYDDYYFIKRVEPPVNLSPAQPSGSVPERTSPVSVESTNRTIVKYLDLPFAEMVYIPGGTFQMGDTYNAGGSDEKPAHTVTVSPFLMGKYEVTQRQWASVMETNPSRFNDCLDCPVEQVSWDDVQEFLKRINDKAGNHYRLPTEAEWEYAAGGGSDARTRFGNGKNVLVPQEANFDASPAFTTSLSEAGIHRKKTQKVGSFPHNSLGLYDMTGNVNEWCSDWYDEYNLKTQMNPMGARTGTFRILRGGSWDSSPQHCRITYRRAINPSYYSAFDGLRLVAQAP